MCMTRIINIDENIVMESLKYLTLTKKSYNVYLNTYIL